MITINLVVVYNLNSGARLRLLTASINTYLVRYLFFFTSILILTVEIVNQQTFRLVQYVIEKAFRSGHRLLAF